jgi:SAM-dependent methyltransferase
MIYDLIADTYDNVNSDIDYCEWADFIEKIIRREWREGNPSLVLDLGCGTGSMTIELAKRGYDMTGVDYSVEMLDVARERALVSKVGDRILWLCQDMTEIDLYGTVDVVVSCLDCINHLVKTADVKKCFSLVHNFLNPNGLFIFDINGKYKFENVYSDKSYIIEEKDTFISWQNRYNPKSCICDFYITRFSEQPDGTYVREDEMQRERMYTLKSIRKMLKDTGFELIGEYSCFDMSPGTDDDERIYIAARRKK